MKKRNNEKEQRIKELAQSLNDLEAVFYRRSDIGASTLFTDVFQDVHRYNSSAREWFVYRSGIWEMDPEGMAAKSNLKLLGEALCQYAAGLNIREEDKKAFVQYACKWLSAGFRNTILNDARDLCCFGREDLDRDIFALNCRNGVLNLRNGKVRFYKHKPDFLLSKITETDFNQYADCPRWKKFLDEVTEGNKEKQLYLQKVAGLSLIGEVPEHRFFIIYGSTTRNGKSTFTETLLHVLGSYGAVLNPETLAIQKTDSRRASGDLARLAGIRLAICSEAPRRMPLDSALLKKLTGGEKILARHLMEREFEFQPQFTLILNTNYLPTTTDTTVFTSGRISVCEFNRHFEESEQDRNLKNKLFAESSGILNWMIKGYQLYMKDGLTAPETIRNETLSYEMESDRIGQFIAENLEESKEAGAFVSVKEIYPVYSKWCDESGYTSMGKQGFIAELKTKRIYKEKFYTGFGAGKKRNVNGVIVGYKRDEWVKAPAENPFPEDYF